MTHPRATCERDCASFEPLRGHIRGAKGSYYSIMNLHSERGIYEPPRAKHGPQNALNEALECYSKEKQ